MRKLSYTELNQKSSSDRIELSNPICSVVIRGYTREHFWCCCVKEQVFIYIAQAGLDSWQFSCLSLLLELHVCNYAQLNVFKKENQGERREWKNKKHACPTSTGTEYSFCQKFTHFLPVVYYWLCILPEKNLRVGLLFFNDWKNLKRKY